MAIEFLIILLIGLLGSAVFLLFVNNKKAKIITATIVFFLYVILLAIGVFANGINFKNLQINYTGKWAAKDILWSPLPPNIDDFVVNIIMLIPVGIYIGALFNKPLIKTMIIGFCIGLFIELMQFILPIDRTPQLSDFLLNAISAVIGCLYSMLILWIKQRCQTKKQSVNIIEKGQSITEEKAKEKITKN